MVAPHIQPFLSKEMPKAAWNPSDIGVGIGLSNNNLTATCTDGSHSSAVRGITPRSTGKWYFEITTGANYTGYLTGFGITNINAVLSDDVAIFRTPLLLASKFGIIYFNNTPVANYAGGNTNANFSGGSVLCCAVDLDIQRAYFRYETAPWNWNSPPSNANPATGANGIDISVNHTSFAAYPVFTSATTGNALTANFGATAFGFAVPAGFSAWG